MHGWVLKRLLSTSTSIIVNGGSKFRLRSTNFYMGEGRGPKEIMSSEQQGKVMGKRPDFRWYHLPANNVCHLLTFEMLENSNCFIDDMG